MESPDLQAELDWARAVLAPYPDHAAYCVADLMSRLPDVTPDQARWQLASFWTGLGADEPMSDAEFHDWLARLPEPARSEAQALWAAAQVHKSGLPSFAADPDVEGGGHWVTINGHPVFLDGGGHATQGPKFLYGPQGVGYTAAQQTLLNDHADAVAASQAYHLAAQIPDQWQKTTIGAAVMETPTGVRYLVYSTNENRDTSPTVPYVRPQVGDLLIVNQDTEMPAQWVYGKGHAETKIIDYANATGNKIIALGASNPICRSCYKVIAANDVHWVTPLKVYGKGAKEAP